MPEMNLRALWLAVFLFFFVCLFVFLVWKTKLGPTVIQVEWWWVGADFFSMSWPVKSPYSKL